MFGPIKTVIFDFDGTLVDTMPSVFDGLGGAIEHVTGRKVPHGELAKTFGPAPLQVLQHWLPEEKIMEAYSYWIQFEQSRTPADFCPFPGVVNMLDALKATGLTIGIFTGRDRASTIKIARAHGWLGHYFSEAAMVCGDDGLPVKPRPEGLWHLEQALSFDKKHALMVGDHPYDMQAGRAAGFLTGAVLWRSTVLDRRNSDSKSARSLFSEAWTHWDGQPVDIRLDSPASLARWIDS